MGDCKFRMHGKTNEKFWVSEEICARARALTLQSWRLSGMSDAAIMAHADYDGVINDLLRHEANFLNRENNDHSFGAIMGLPVPEVYVERYPVSAGELVITSDGYPTVCDTLEQSEAALTKLLELDPLCIDQNLQCKGLGPDRVSFDDRCFIRAHLLPQI